MKVGDLVSRLDCASHKYASSIGVVIQIERYDPDKRSVHVQWCDESFWYEENDLEVIVESG